ncbi:MAG: hypothetical protein ACRDK2_01090, partial [Solirubrobacteraceae bacterium]
MSGRLTDGLITQVLSGDIDFLGDVDDVRLAGKLLDGTVRVSRWEDRTTLVGVAMFLDSEGHKRRLDFMQSAYGMSSDDIRNTAIQID